MLISLAPQRSDARLTVSRDGDVITINGEQFDFSDLPDAAEIPYGEVPCVWIFGPVRRVSGQLQLIMIMPHGPNPPHEVAFPVSIIDPPDGAIALPTNGLTIEEVSEDVEA